MHAAAPVTESLLRILGTAAVAYVAVVALAFFFQRSLLYFPSGAVPAPAAAGLPEAEAVHYATADGLELGAWYVAPRAGRPVIAYFHGNGGNLALRAPLVRPFVDAGYGVLLAGYRGYGGNPGRPGEAGLMADGRAALAFLAGRGVAPARTVLFGESLGSAVAVQMAVERGAGAVILDAPFTSAVDVARHHYRFLPVRWLMRDRYDTLARIAAIGAPLLVIHGIADFIVPVAQARRLLAAAAEPKEGVFVEGAGHEGLALRASGAILAFLARTFPDSG